MAETKQETDRLAQMIDRYFDTLDHVEDMAAKLKALKESADAQEIALLDFIEAQDMRQVKDAQGRTVFVKKPRIYGSINKENEAKAMEYIKKEWDGAYLFKEQVSSSALGRVVRERLEQGLDVPEEFVTYYAKRQLGYRSSRRISEE